MHTTYYIVWPYRQLGRLEETRYYVYLCNTVDARAWKSDLGPEPSRHLHFLGTALYIICSFGTASVTSRRMRSLALDYGRG